MFILLKQMYFKLYHVLQLLLPLNCWWSHVYIVAPLASIPDLPALSCQEIKLGEGKDSISKSTGWIQITSRVQSWFTATRRFWEVGQ